MFSDPVQESFLVRGRQRHELREYALDLQSVKTHFTRSQCLTNPALLLFRKQLRHLTQP